MNSRCRLSAPTPKGQHHGALPGFQLLGRGQSYAAFPGLEMLGSGPSNKGFGAQSPSAQGASSMPLQLMDTAATATEIAAPVLKDLGNKQTPKPSTVPENDQKVPAKQVVPHKSVLDAAAELSEAIAGKKGARQTDVHRMRLGQKTAAKDTVYGKPKPRRPPKVPCPPGGGS